MPYCAKRAQQGLVGHIVINIPHKAGVYLQVIHADITDVAQVGKLVAHVFDTDLTAGGFDAVAQQFKGFQVAEGLSEWNSKGTFEDRDFLPWAKQQLPGLIEGQVRIHRNTFLFICRAL